MMLNTIMEALSVVPWKTIAAAVITALVLGITSAVLILKAKMAPPFDLPKPKDATKRFKKDRDRALVEMMEETPGKCINFEGTMATCDPKLASILIPKKVHSLPRSIVYRMFPTFIPYSDGLLFSQNEDWERQHKMLFPIFQPPNFDRFASVSQDQAREVCKVLTSNEYRQDVEHYGREMEDLRKSDSPMIRNYEPDRWAKEPVGIDGSHDLWTTIRYMAVRFLVSWGYGLDPDSSLGRVIARQTDWFSRATIDLLPTLGFLNMIKYYLKSLSVSKDIKKSFAQVYNNGYYKEDENNEGKSIGGGAYPNFISAMVDNGCSLDEIASQANHIQGAHKAVALTTTFVLYELERSPEYKKRVRKELKEVIGPNGCPTSKDLKYEVLPETWKVLQETLRLHPVTMGVMRKAGEDITYGDHVIPKDTEVCVWIQALQCHKEFWDKPFKFDPERWEGKVPRGQYMPFLDGTRKCAGYALAHMQLLNMLFVLLTEYDVSVLTKSVTVKPNMFTGIDGLIEFKLGCE